MTIAQRWSSWLLLVAIGCGSTSPGADDRGTTLADQRLSASEPRQVPKASDLIKQAEQKLAAGDGEGAQALIEQALEQDSEDARAYLDLGIAREMQSDVPGAETAYRKAVSLQNDLSEALNNLGVLVRDRGELSEAVSLLRRSTLANDRSAAAHLNLALALEDSADLVPAEAAYARAVVLEPKDAMARANYGLLLLKLQKPQQAARELRTAAQYAAGDRAALLTIGNGLRRAGEPEAAVAAMQAAVEAGDKPTPALLSELALAQRAAGDRDAAIATLERAVAVDKRFAIAHYLLGNLHAGAKRFDKAKKHYKRYLKLAPDGDMAAKARERLKMVAKAQ